MSAHPARSPVVFRDQACLWLARVQPAPGGTPQVFEVGGQRIVVAEQVDCPDGLSLRETLIVRGRFQCGARCRFQGPVYVGGDAQVGKSSEMEIMCIEGAAVLGPGAQVCQWVHSFGALDLRAGTWVGGAASSDHSIRLGLDAGARLLYAPSVASPAEVEPEPPAPDPESILEFPPPHRGRPELGVALGYRESKLSALGAETWVYDGNLHLPFPVALAAKVVVRGSFSCAPLSLLDDDVKAGADLRVGAHSLCRGQLTARGNLTLDEGCYFGGALQAGMTLRLRTGVRGFREAGPVEVEARDRLLVDPGVVVRGKLRSDTRVLAAAPELEGGLELLVAGV